MQVDGGNRNRIFDMWHRLNMTPSVKRAVIGVIGVIAAAFIGGIFILINTVISHNLANREPQSKTAMSAIGNTGFVQQQNAEKIINNAMIQPVIISQEIKSNSDVEMIDLHAKQEQSEIIVLLRNNSGFDTSFDVNVWLGNFCIGNTPHDDQIEWIKSNNKTAIKSGKIEKFIFHLPIKKIMYVVMLLEDKELRKGIMLDEMHVAYTWNYWHVNEWTWWQNHRNNVTESLRMQDLLDKFNECIEEHSVNRDYETCLVNKKPK